jgi:hypothetical protein
MSKTESLTQAFRKSIGKYSSMKLKGFSRTFCFKLQISY